MSERTGVYIASRYRLVRGMFCSLLTGKCGMEVLGEAADGEAAWQDISRLRPQLVLLDIDLSGLTGLELTGQILSELPCTRVVAVTEEPEEAWLIAFLRLGGMGYLHNCCSEADIMTALERVMTGGIHLEPAGTKLLVDRVCGSPARAKQFSGKDTPPQVLSERERQILHLYARGYSSADIGELLFLSVSTVGTYIRRIRDKVHLEHKAELVEYALRNDLYDDWK